MPFFNSHGSRPTGDSTNFWTSPIHLEPEEEETLNGKSTPE